MLKASRFFGKYSLEGLATIIRTLNTAKPYKIKTKLSSYFWVIAG
jgi:hypothetical protein